MTMTIKHLFKFAISSSLSLSLKSNSNLNLASLNDNVLLVVISKLDGIDLAQLTATCKMNGLIKVYLKSITKASIDNKAMLHR
jgi:hypothetical protein